TPPARPVAVPPGASVEGMRGAEAVREAALRALAEAGARKGLTGKGTGARNALLAALSSETLQSMLPGMTTGPLEVPGLHEAALVNAQRANLKVYARLLDPRLDSLTDGVKLENPTSRTQTTGTEVKHSDSGDVTVGLPAFGYNRKAVDGQGEPDLPRSVNSASTGPEWKHSAEDSTTGAGRPTSGTAQNLKPSGRTALVEFDVEYRFVAEVDGREVTFDLRVPRSADLRMPVADLEPVLGRTVDADLAAAQDAVQAAAKTWRDAQALADRARHHAQRLLIDQVAAQQDVARLADREGRAQADLGAAQGDVAAARRRHDAVLAAHPALTDLPPRIDALGQARSHTEGLLPGLEGTARDTRSAVELLEAESADLAERSRRLRERLAEIHDAEIRDAVIRAAGSHRAAPDTAPGTTSGPAPGPTSGPAPGPTSGPALDTASDTASDTPADNTPADNTPAESTPGGDLAARTAPLTAELDQVTARLAEIDADLVPERRRARDAATALDDARRTAREHADGIDRLTRRLETTRAEVEPRLEHERAQERAARARAARSAATLADVRQQLEDARAAAAGFPALIEAAKADLRDRQTAADTAQRTWWDAKKTADRLIGEFAPAPN
ncbi:hypothetical protein J7S33_19170, partial [Saccharothrix algeriensis]